MTQAPAFPDTRPPNIVLIFSDDHGYADLGRAGVHAELRTPNLDRLAAQGATCSNAYVTAPVCSPSRAGLIAGAYQQRWGAYWFDDCEFPSELPSLAERLSAVGYATGYFGKVHYGSEEVGDRACPPHHGFHESFYGLAGHSLGRLHYLRHSTAAVEEYGEAAGAMGVQPMLSGDESVDFNGHLTAELGRRAREFVATYQEQPFFVMLAFNAVHNFNGQLPDHELKSRGLPPFADWDPRTSEYLDWYDGAIWPHLADGRGYYLAQLELMDTQIGLLLDELETRGLTGNTCVVYTTDNGGSRCNFGDNSPLRGSKYTLFEGGIRVPFLVTWPGGGVPPGSRCDALVSTLDLLPTFVTATGTKLPAAAVCDGLDLLPLLRGEQSRGHEVLHFDTGFQWAVRHGRWKLRYVDGEAPVVAAIRQVEHTDLGVGQALVDVDADPGEKHDVSAQHPHVVEALTALHTAWDEEVTSSGQGGLGRRNRG